MTVANRLQVEMDDGALEKAGPRRMLNEKQVLEIVPVSRTTLYRMIKAGQFPEPTYISPNRRVWFEDEIIAWQNGINGRRRGRWQHPTSAKS
jgi:prophage regulatory protein